MLFCVFRQAAGVQSGLTRIALKIKCPALNCRNLPLKRRFLSYMHLLLSICLHSNAIVPVSSSVFRGAIAAICAQPDCVYAVLKWVEGSHGLT